MAFNSILSPVTNSLQAIADVASAVADSTKILTDAVETNLEARKKSRNMRVASVVASHKESALANMEAYAKAEAKFTEKTGKTPEEMMAELLS
jgi:hypothetical protein